MKIVQASGGFYNVIIATKEEPMSLRKQKKTRSGWGAGEVQN
jgi:hypothetical protein